MNVGKLMGLTRSRLRLASAVKKPATPGVGSGKGTPGWDDPVRPPYREQQPTSNGRRGWFWGSGALTRLSLAVLALGLVSMLAVVGDSVLHSSPVAAISPYSFPFTMGKPAGPTPWNPSTWDIATHIRTNYQFGGLDAMQAQHASDCAPTPATHAISSYRDAVFLCNNHVMTAMSAGGYGVIYLTPDHMFDWSGGTATLS